MEEFEKCQEEPEPPSKMRRPKGAPKHAKSAYIYFVQERHAQMKEQKARGGGDKRSQAEIIRVIADDWKNLPAREKARFVELSDGDKYRYRTEKDAYQGPLRVPTALGRSNASANAGRGGSRGLTVGGGRGAGREVRGRGRSRGGAPVDMNSRGKSGGKVARRGLKKLKQAGDVKRPKCAFLFFSSEKRDAIRAQNPQMKVCAPFADLMSGYAKWAAWVVSILIRVGGCIDVPSGQHTR
jgi:hypothetical protein